MIQPDYKKWCGSVGIATPDMTRELNKLFPHFTRITAAMVNAPEKYGMCLLPAAEDHLARRFGIGDGLAWVQYIKENIRARRDEHRKKGHRITFWMASDLYFRLLSLKTSEEYGTFQAVVEAALVQFIERERMRKAEIVDADGGALT